jgi:membrane protease YdiL (CAAX protease family)
MYFDLCSFLKLNFLKNRAGYIAIIPCLIIAINNFPFVPFFANMLVFDYALLDIVLFALECIAVGLFEELAYRACVFGIILKNRRKTTKDIFVSVIISSLIFGASHLINIVAGASIPATLLQTGYSFLIGAMCSFVILMTASVWPCVIIHAIYNFCGGVAPRFAYGKIWTAGEVILTAALSVIVIIYVVIKMSKVRPSDRDRFYS